METQTNFTKPKFSVGFFFLSIGILISLITSVVSFLSLVFETLNKRFPDVLNSNYQYGYSTYEYESIRMALATLIIFFPVFLVISFFWKKFIRSGIGSIDEIVRKWVIYIILFLSSLIVVVDLVTLVRYFISGEITYRFILKVATILVVAGLVGFYYVFLLKEREGVKYKTGIVWASAGIILVVVSISYSFMIIGSPMKQRLLRLDDRRVGDLQNIQYQVINYWQQKEKLPVDLKELSNPLSGYSLPVEPEFEKGKKYEYGVKDSLTFELCATFSLPMPKGWREYGGGDGGFPMPLYDKTGYTMSYPYPYPGSGTNESWDHQEGRTCFERTIDKDIYPSYPKPTR
ncbi:hypothetical protein A3A03_03640 [Candidatus Nomurabacteria bacterium RIFCSPLOWO2_01_FULL_40_18]|uniref:DUF5671 domain-containing protein n=1 Tax=Candidatus Nomurabacteria bacterium RIFCSPLOWO2_01_FULL_40_18 TaxID=1801773 RepID=A0A1F6XIZ7_9BACT|nr:MAG: hypothetical protein A3A03_03640 [Candidatus Nomurabacteria bacterium RIFCSPLOWO2_01_FULL_40_18]